MPTAKKSHHNRHCINDDKKTSKNEVNDLHLKFNFLWKKTGRLTNNYAKRRHFYILYDFGIGSFYYNNFVNYILQKPFL
jgi:hypothetical protein